MDDKYLYKASLAGTQIEREGTMSSDPIAYTEHFRDGWKSAISCAQSFYKGSVGAVAAAESATKGHLIAAVDSSKEVIIRNVEDTKIEAIYNMAKDVALTTKNGFSQVANDVGSLKDKWIPAVVDKSSVIEAVGAPVEVAATTTEKVSSSFSTAQKLLFSGGVVFVVLEAAAILYLYLELQKPSNTPPRWIKPSFLQPKEPPSPIDRSANTLKSSQTTEAEAPGETTTGGAAV